MGKTMNIREAVRRRISVRHYMSRPVPEDILRAVLSAGENSVALDRDIGIHFHLFTEGKRVAQRMTMLTGTRMLFGSAPHFIVATSEQKPLFMANMGFRMEQMILFATQQGLGTCWVGGMFHEQELNAALGLEKDERVIALTPLGYADTSVYGKIARNIVEVLAANFGRRKPLRQIAFGSEWGLAFQTEDSELLEILECTRLAPSWANTQPWRFLVSKDEIIVVSDASRRYSSVRDGKHYYRLDVGIAMSHFYLTAREIGWTGAWQVTGFDPSELVHTHHIPTGYEVIGMYRW